MPLPLRSNILDPIHAELDPRIWDQPASPRPVLKPEHAHWIKREVYDTLETAGYTDVSKWLTLVLTGSLTTYQYSEDSDIDISLFVDSKEFPEWSRAEMIALMVGRLDGHALPGTPFPLQDFVVGKQIKPSDLYKPGLRSGYNIDNGKWIVPPEKERSHNVQSEEGGFYAYALQMSDKMERLLRYEPEKAVEFWHAIHKKRQRDMAAGKGDFAESNIIYKFLANRGLFPALSEASGEYIAKVGTQNVMYHVSPLEARESIESHGLDHRRSFTPNYAEEEGHPPGIWLYDRKPWEEEHYTPGREDVWQVDMTGLRPNQMTGFADDHDEPEMWMVPHAIEPQRIKRIAVVRKAHTAAGEETQPFFTEAQEGGHEPRQPLLPEHVSQDPRHQEIYSNMQRYFGPFDRHIETSIPGFRTNSLRKADSLLRQPGGRFLDIAGSTGSLGKTLSHMSNGMWETDTLDPNPAMVQHFQQTPVVGANSVPGWFDQYHPPTPYDVVHESMGFQFMGPNRPEQIAQAKNLLTPGGLFLSEQKFHTPNEAENEWVKDNQFKNQYYDPQQLAQKNQQVGFQGQGPMTDNLARDSDYENMLREQYAHVAPYWQSGNFRGYAASDDPKQVEQFLEGYKPFRVAKTVEAAQDWFAPSYMLPDHAKEQISQYSEGLPWPQGSFQQPPEKYHVTGLYSPEGFNNPQHKAWAESKSGMIYPAQTSALESFGAGGPKGHPIVLRVAHPALQADTEALQDEAEQRGIPVSRHPSGYKPHITLGYSPEPIEADHPHLGFPVGPLRELHDYYDSLKLRNASTRVAEATRPPHLRRGTSKEFCGNCWAFKKGHCEMFGGYKVHVGQTCDDWEGEKGDKTSRVAAPQPQAKFAYDPDTNHLLLGQMGREEGENLSHHQLMQHPAFQGGYKNMAIGTVRQNGYANVHNVFPEGPNKNTYQLQYQAEEALRRALPGAKFPNPTELLRPEWELADDPDVTYVGEPPVIQPDQEQAKQWSFRAATDKAQLAQIIYDRAQRGEGATIGLDGSEPSEQYVFAPDTATQTRIPLNEFSPGNVEGFILRYASRLQEPGKYIGSWIEGNDVVLDVSEEEGDYGKAFKKAWDGHQRAMWDMHANDEVPVRGLDYDQTLDTV